MVSHKTRATLRPSHAHYRNSNSECQNILALAALVRPRDPYVSTDSRPIFLKLTPRSLGNQGLQKQQQGKLDCQSIACKCHALPRFLTTLIMNRPVSVQTGTVWPTFPPNEVGTLPRNPHTLIESNMLLLADLSPGTHLRNQQETV